MKGGVLRIVLAGLWLALSALLSLQPASAQALLAGDSVETCVARVAPGDTPRAMLATRARFDCATPQTDFGRGDFWVLSRAFGGGPRHGETRVRMMSLWQSALTLYAVYGDGRVVAMPTRSDTLGRRLQLGAVVEFAPPLRRAPLTGLMWRVEDAANARGIVRGVRLSDPSGSSAANLKVATFYAGFVGLALALTIYNLALWVALRHRFLLVYCVMTAALMGYAFTSSGAMAWVLPGFDNNDRIRLNYVLLGLAASAAMLFARTFFEDRVFDGWVGRVTIAAAGICAASGASYVAITVWNVSLADRIASIAFLTGLLAMVPILWNAWARGSRYLVVFAIAWAVPLVSAGLRILSALRVVPTTFWIDNSTVLSLAFEALMSSIAIAWRVRMLSVERDEAREREHAARRLADVDPLTSLLNRRALLDAVTLRPGVQTVHVVDIDHFKAINDTLGHDGGDEVLRVFARALRESVPDSAVVARLGGEEFAVVTAGEATLEAERILARLRQARMPFDVRVTASIGSCTGTLASETEWRALYRCADRALFEAKQAGRDRARRAETLAAAA